MSEFFAASLGPDRAAADVLNWSRLLQQPSAGAKEKPTTWSAPEAFVAILFSAVTCDGELTAIEHEELLALAHRSRALKTLSRQELAVLNTTVLDRLRAEETALADACGALPEEMRLAAFAHALDLVLADGELNIEEADFLNALILNLKLDREDVQKVADVIVLKNQY